MSDNDVECPYCDQPQEINHDEGYGLDESKFYKQQCSDCDKFFSFTVTISIDHWAEIADCLNGGKHHYRAVFHHPKSYPSWKKCVGCGHEEGGPS